MLKKDDGMIAIVDMAISLVEFLVDFIGALFSGDTGVIKDLFGKLTGKE